MPELIAPTARLESSWRAAREEWPGAHQDGTGLRLAETVETAEGFTAWVELLNRQSDPLLPLGEGAVHADYWWMVDGDRYLGAIDLRHELTPFLLEAGGHVGYSVRPSARGRGLAAWALSQVLPQAARRGLDRVLVVCAEENIASARTIERNGGVLEDVRSTSTGVKRRYWIPT